MSGYALLAHTPLCQGYLPLANTPGQNISSMHNSVNASFRNSGSSFGVPPYDSGAAYGIAAPAGRIEL